MNDLAKNLSSGSLALLCDGDLGSSLLDRADFDALLIFDSLGSLVSRPTQLALGGFARAEGLGI